MSRYSLKRKSVLFKANSHLLINQFSWINSINDEYSNATITRSKIASIKYHYYCYYLKKVNNEIVLLSFISIITSIVISELYIFKTNSFLDKINPDERKNSNFYYQSEFFSMKYFEQMEEREISKVENGFIIFNIVISSLISLLLWIKVTLVVNKMYVEKSSSKYDNVFSLWLFPKYLIESVIALIFLMIGKNIQSNWDDLNEIIFNKGNVEDDILYCVKNAKDCSSHIAKIISMQTRIKNYLLKRMNAKFKETHQVVYHSSNVLFHVSPNKSKRGSGLTFGKRKKISKMKEDLEESKLSSIVNIKLKKNVNLASSILTKLSDSGRKKKFKSGAIKHYVYFK